MRKLNIWAVWPTISLERSEVCCNRWHEQGYKTAVLVNPPYGTDHVPFADMVMVQPDWAGFPTAVNLLCRIASADIVVVVGDDVDPDKKYTAQEIGEGFVKRFPDLYGVMQPIGDKFGWTHKCAVSPWIGRAFVEESYDGNGPYREEYFHYFSDQELQEYAITQEAFQQRADLTQYHDHWQRQENPQRPPHLMKAKKQWHQDKIMFEERKAKGWPV